MWSMRDHYIYLDITEWQYITDAWRQMSCHIIDDVTSSSWFRVYVRTITSFLHNISSDVSKWSHVMIENDLLWRAILRYTCMLPGTKIELVRSLSFVPSKFAPDSIFWTRQHVIIHVTSAALAITWWSWSRDYHPPRNKSENGTRRLVQNWTWTPFDIS